MCCRTFYWNIQKCFLNFLIRLCGTKCQSYRILLMLDTGTSLFPFKSPFEHFFSMKFIFRLIFGIESCDRKVLLSRLVGFVCERNAHALVMADSAAAANKTSNQTDLTTSALMILSEINRKYPAEMKYNGLQIMVSECSVVLTLKSFNSKNYELQRLIDHSSDFSLGQFRLVMNIICSIAYSEPPCEQLKDHIDMLVKKQVSSSIRNVKNRGIIGVIRVIDHMVWEKKDNRSTSSSPPSSSNDLNSSFLTVEALPTKLSRVAANYIGRAWILICSDR